MAFAFRELITGLLATALACLISFAIRGGPRRRAQVGGERVTHGRDRTRPTVGRCRRGLRPLSLPIARRNDVRLHSVIHCVAREACGHDALVPGANCAVRVVATLQSVEGGRGSKGGCEEGGSAVSKEAWRICTRAAQAHPHNERYPVAGARVRWGSAVKERICAPPKRTRMIDPCLRMGW